MVHEEVIRFMNTLQEFHFIRPWWLLGLVVIPVIFFFRYRNTQQRSGWDKVISRDLLSVLIPTAGIHSLHRWIEFVTLGLFVIAIVAVAGPTWQRVPSPTEYVQDDLVVILDLSYSMYVEDIKPSRLIRAKQKIVDLLENRSEGHTALIVYSSTAHVVTPLTTDNDTIQHLMSSLEPRMMPEYGSNIDDALSRAVDLIEQGSHSNGRILLITDGIETLNLGSYEWSHETPIHVIGVGTAEGGAIPQVDLEGNVSYLRDQRENLIIASMNQNRLARLATLSGGTYHDIDISESDIQQFFSIAWDSIRERLVDDERTFDQWYDVGYLLLIPLVLGAMFAIRRGVIVVIVLCLFVAEDSYANWFTDLWKNSDQKGSELLEKGEFDLAEQAFEDPEWRAIAQYRQQKYNQAAEYFDSSDSVRSLYNYGNTLALQGEIAEAINTYNKVLEQDSNHEDAKFNRDLLEQWLQQQMQQEATNSGTSNENNAGEQQQQSEASSDPSNPTPDSQQSMDNQMGEEGEENELSEANLGDQDENTDTPIADENSQNSETEEQAQSLESNPDSEEAETADSQEVMSSAEQDRETEATLERMLRRVSDEPGNLLKQKFLHEARLRYRRGELPRTSIQKW